MIKKVKNRIRNFQLKTISYFFKKRDKHKFLQYYFRGKDYVFDIINYYENNNLQTIFDVGANIGQSAERFRYFFKFAKIFSFEPINETFKILENKFINDKNTICCNFALSECKEEKIINLSNDKGLNSLVPEVNIDFDNLNQQKVFASTIDDYCKEKSIEFINLIKIDTEGYDFLVLKGAEQILSNKNVDFIVCEVDFIHSKNKGNFEEINNYLKNKGFLLSGFYDNVYWGKKNLFLGFVNAMFVKEDLVFPK